jgi:hypothetical protein
MGDAAFRPPLPALFAVVTEPALLREREREQVLGRAAKASGKELARACRVINCNCAKGKILHHLTIANSRPDRRL